MQQYADRTPKAVERLEEGSDDAMAVMALPERYRKRLPTTNALERPNEESRRRERAVRIFPNTKPAERLTGAVLMESDEAWTAGRRYLDMEEYWAWRAEQEAKREEGTSDVNHSHQNLAA